MQNAIPMGVLNISLVTLSWLHFHTEKSTTEYWVMDWIISTHQIILAFRNLAKVYRLLIIIIRSVVRKFPNFKHFKHHCVFAKFCHTFDIEFLSVLHYAWKIIIFCHITRKTWHWVYHLWWKQTCYWATSMPLFIWWDYH